MNAKYRIEVGLNPATSLWEAFVRVDGVVANRHSPGFESRMGAEEWAEKWATDHARSQASRRSYDFFPTL